MIKEIFGQSDNVLIGLSGELRSPALKLLSELKTPSACQTLIIPNFSFAPPMLKV
jgi:hypothetical protein